MRDAVAVVIVKGVNTSQGNAPVAVQGTGFWISQDGYLVTAHHLLTKLIEAGVDAGTVTIEVRTARGAVVPANPTPLWFGPVDDVMVLYASLQGQPISTLARADVSKAGLKPGKTPIYAAGYPNGIGYSVSPGFIKSLDGPVQPLPLWTTSITFKEGESGSPVLLANDAVVAVAKGDDLDATQIGLVVPSRAIPKDYWDGGPTPVGDAASTGRILVETLATPQPVFHQVQINLENEHCHDAQRKTQVVGARAGWRIDPGSAVLSQISSRGFNNGPALIDIAASDQIVVGAKLANIGGCLLDGQVAADITAQVIAVLRYREIPLPGQHWVSVSSVSLTKDVETPLPSVPADALRVSVVDADGDKKQVGVRADELVRSGGVNLLSTGKLRGRLEAAAASR